ncbi:MAG: hypothetical protein ACRD0J_02270 [Acidimicrobiales bacterium]
MATILATCPGCGDVELVETEVRALYCTTTGRSSFAFACPTCRRPVSTPAGAGTVEVLAGAGVAVTRWQLPAEAAEAHRGPPIDQADVDAFCAQLYGAGLTPLDWPLH